MQNGRPLLTQKLFMLMFDISAYFLAEMIDSSIDHISLEERESLVKCVSWDACALGKAQLPVEEVL